MLFEVVFLHSQADLELTILLPQALGLQVCTYLDIEENLEVCSSVAGHLASMFKAEGRGKAEGDRGKE